MLDRRHFLQSTLAAGLAPVALASCSARGATTDPLFRISLAQWSLHRRLLGRAEPKLDNLDFAATARGFGIEAIEYVNRFFEDKARDAKYLAEMQRRADGEGVASLLIMIDGAGQLGDPDDARRAEAVANHVPWLEAAKALGCHSIRVNAQSAGTDDEQRDRVADGLRALCERAEPFALGVIVENHGGLSSNGAWLASVMRQVDHPLCGTLPDFGNFGDYDRYRGVEELMPWAKAVSAKSHDFGPDGRETHTDFERMMRVVLAAGYHGWVGIEYEGSALPEDEGILATKALLESVRAAIAGAA